MNVHQVLLAGYGASGGGGGGGYPPFANMASGLHFNGSDGSTTFTDVTGKTWGTVGSPAIETDQSVFGGASGFFPGSSYIEHLTSGGDAFAYGTGDFCWCGWVRLTTTSGNQYILDHDSNGGTLFVISGQIGYYNTTTALGPLYTTGVSLEVDTWHFIEASRVSGTTYLFKNGTLIASQSDSYNYASTNLRYGTFGGGGSTLNNAYLDDWTIFKGVGWHTSSYTPPPSPFPDS